MTKFDRLSTAPTVTSFSAPAAQFDAWRKADEAMTAAAAALDEGDRTDLLRTSRMRLGTRSERSPRRLPWKASPQFAGLLQTPADKIAARQIRDTMENIVREALARGITPAQTASELTVAMADCRTLLVMACAIGRSAEDGGSPADIADAVLSALSAEDPGLLRFALASGKAATVRGEQVAAEEASARH
ncbi:hypothetical protein E9232_004873 [Inquilinus ginsengisoli]|uniref:Uncharacterized protein n=1 Tax=Inquilinus ginsengisoli TaxID=363840 RepID=A0ABU1JUN9_9PROT|nr:hypothetical protein [Inquilinus ginsengisoli]MDR6292333.1 hypothetical protein [Inquilinus ginsengisoli]